MSCWLGQDCLSGEISFSSSCTVARSWASPMAAGMMSLVWRYGWSFMVSLASLISKLAGFHLLGKTTYIFFNAFHSCRASISVTLKLRREHEWTGNSLRKSEKKGYDKHGMKVTVWQEELFLLTCFEFEVWWFNLMSSSISPTWFSST